MSLSDIQFPDDNPFCRIKVRHIILGFIFFFFIVFFWYGLIFGAISTTTNSNTYTDLDPVVELSLLILCFLLTGAWLWRQCNLAGIKIKCIVGKLPRNYRWGSLIGLIIAKFFVLIGIFRIFYYFISFWAYSWVENQLKLNLDNSESLSDLAKTFSPKLYLLLDFLSIFIFFIFLLFFFYGVVLHRWSLKWGIKKTLLYLCLFILFIGILSRVYIAFALVIYVLFDILIYLKTKTLLTVFIGYLVDMVVNYAWNYSIFGKYDLSISLVEQLRDRVWIGAILLVISTPFLARFFYQNWHRINEPLPYFINAAQDK
jgi:uncharacterized protein